MQARVSDVVTGIVGKKGSFWSRVHFLSFPHGRDRGDLDRVENQLHEYFVVCSSFEWIEGIESIFSFGKLEMLVFLSLPCSSWGRVVADLTVNCVYAHYWSSFMAVVTRRSLLQCCQHVYILENMCTFSKNGAVL